MNSAPSSSECPSPAANPCPSQQARLFAFLVRWVLRPLLVGLAPILSTHGLKFCGRLLELTGGFSRVPSERRTVGGVPCDVLLPPGDRARLTVLFLHGGGFAIHLPNAYRRFGGLLAKRLDAEVFIPDYRLTPAHPYPAALDDCVATYAELLRLGSDPKQLIVIGDSAGGNLTLSTLLRARDEGLPMPVCAVAISPATDLSLRSPSLRDNARRDPMGAAGILPGLVAHYVGPDLVEHPYVSPVFGKYSGLPPLAFFAGDAEILRDDTQRAAACARRDGVPTEVVVAPHMQHCYPLFQFLPEAREALDQIVAFITRHTGTTTAEAQPAATASSSCA